MSFTYKVITGDTFESIARKQYGTEVEADRIARANPGVSEPLTPGIAIAIPILPSAPQDLQQQAAAESDDEVALLIDGDRFRFFSRIRITRAIDSISTIEFSAPFESDSPELRETFRPFSYKPMTVTVGGDPLFTGIMVGVSPILENDRKTVGVSGYSLPGVLDDCTPPASFLQLERLEFNNQGLTQIAESIAAPFGLSVEFLADQGAVFERVAAKPEKKVLSFLIELAKQRNLVTSDTELGALVFQQSVAAGSPVARLQQGASPILSVAPFFSPQEYYSHITGLGLVTVGTDGSQFTVKNERLEGVIRPVTFKTPDTTDADVKAAVEAKVGRMFGNMAAYSVQVDTWRTPSGELWAPNTTVTLLAPGAMVYTEYEFVIRSVEFNREPRATTAILNLVIPGAFSGQIPETLPWD